MTNEYLENIIACESSRLKAQKDPFVKNGHMGMCLFLFRMYELTHNMKYYDMAQEFLRNSCLLIKKHSKVNISDGLSGIGLAIIHLYKKKYITGNLYEILQSIDNEIYRGVIQAIEYNKDFSLNGHEEALMDVALYMIERIKVCKIPQLEERILKLFINKIINTLYQRHDFSFYLEPIPYASNYKLARFLLLLSKAFLIETCTNRISHIWEESRRTILAQSPYLDSNKVTLLYAFIELQKRIVSDKRLNGIISTFKRDITITRITNYEIPANSMSMLTGLPGLIELLLRMNMPYKQKDLQILLDKMKSSYFYCMEYGEIKENSFTGLNGVLGFILAYLDVKNTIKS